MLRPNLITDVVAIRFLPAEHGGRATPVNSGYRAQVRFEKDGPAGNERDYVFDFSKSRSAFERDGEVWLPTGVEDVAAMGTTAELYERHSDGDEFEVREGSQVVASGHVLKAAVERR